MPPPASAVPTPDEEEVWARAALTRLAEPGDTALGRALARHGPVDILRAVRGNGPLPPEFGRRDPDAYRVRLGGPGPGPDLDRLAALGGCFVVPGTPGWPTQLDDLGAATPIGLWLRGPAPLRESLVRSVAVVGARACTDYGSYVAGEAGADLAQLRWTVVSGGAYGIDGACHRGCLAVGGITVAVLACGVDTVYPRGHERLVTCIAERGLVVSELPPGERPTRVRFVERNRVIAALTRGTVVVEAAMRSGALGTARRARNLGRHVMAFPGPVTSPQSAGTHALVRDEAAVLVTSGAEVAEQVGLIGDDLAPAPPPGRVRTADGLSVEETRVWEALGAATGPGVVVREVARRAGVSPVAVYRYLSALAARGLADGEEGRWRRTPERRGGA